MNIKNILMVLLFGWLLAACSGDPLPQEGEDDPTTDDDSLVDEGEVTNVSYLPLMTVERYQDWSGLDEDDLFLTYGRAPLISYYTINPVNATTGDPVTDATAGDFSILQDGIPVNPKVNFPMLQKVVGNQVALRTAIVINTSTAMDSVDRSAFIEEIKDFVSAAKDNESHPYYINNQEFTVWAVDGIAVEETGGATANKTAVLNAIDAVKTNWENGSYKSTGANHLYDGVVEAIGRFSGDSQFSVPLDFRDANTGENNDLFDYVTPDFILASTAVVFSAGYGASNHFAEDDFKRAVESQSTFIYPEDVPPSGSATETTNLPKPLIYVVPDGEVKDDIVSGLAHTTIENTIAGGQYSFASDVVSAQISAIEEKNALTNQHVLRWAGTLRTGGPHEVVVKTRTAEDKLGYSLTVDPEYDPGSTAEMPDPQVEITGANNEYLATNDIAQAGGPYDSATTYANLISTFYPATRWTNQTFTSADYTWSFTPAGSMVENSDGSISISDNPSFPITLTLTNNNIDHDGATIPDDFVLTIQASNN